MRLEKHEDERGWLVEAFKEELDNGQVYAFSIKPGKMRANHYHKLKKEWFCVIQGEGTITVGDKTYHVKPLEKIYVPPNEHHTIKNTGKDLLIAVVFSSKKYDPENPDTYTLKDSAEDS